MPALPVIANVIACHVKGHLANGRQWVNGYHVQKPAGTTVAAAIAAIDTLLVALYNTDHAGGGTSILSQMSGASGMDAIYYLPLDGTSATTIRSHSIAGGSGGDSLPAATTLTVTSQSGLRGRDKRGRVFLPPFIESDNTIGGLPIVAVVTELQVNFAGYLADATAVPLFPVVASYKHSSAVLVTNYVVRAQWASRRKRVPRPL